MNAYGFSHKQEGQSLQAPAFIAERVFFYGGFLILQRYFSKEGSWLVRSSEAWTAFPTLSRLEVSHYFTRNITGKKHVPSQGPEVQQALFLAWKEETVMGAPNLFHHAHHHVSA